MGDELLIPGQSEAGWHRLSTVLTCPRKYALGQNKTIARLPPSEPIVRGQLVHAALAHLYVRRMPEGKDRYAEPGQAMLMAAEVYDEKEPSELWMPWAEKLQPMVKQYLAKWGEEKLFEVLSVEEELRARITDEKTGQKHLYTQRADLVVRHRGTRKVYIIDHKTAFLISQRVTNSYTLSGQIAGYRLLGQAAYGEDFGDVILNFIQMPTEKDPLFKFARPGLESAPFAVSTFVQTILHAERTLTTLRSQYGSEIEGGEHWPAVLGEPCMGKYGPCSYRDFCRTGGLPG